VVRRSHIPTLGAGYPLELPNAVRSAAPFAILALLSLLLLLFPGVPVWIAAFAAAAFALAAAMRAAQEHHALAKLRSNLDWLLLRGEQPPLSPVLAWRAGELCSPDAREDLVTELRRIERSAGASHLAGAIPLNRAAVRDSSAEIDALVDRLSAPEPVAARGVILARRLLDDPAGPLYDRDYGAELRPRLRELLAALDDHSRRRA
jgi:hypothetical protein